MEYNVHLEKSVIPQMKIYIYIYIYIYFNKFPVFYGTRAVSSGVKRPGHETDHSPIFNAQVKSGGEKHPLPHTSS
jgi:hypothetical protein